jgi:hypothetical protein
MTGKPETINRAIAHREISEEFLDANFSYLHCGIQIRMVAGFAEVIERQETLVAARYVPNRQFLSVPFRSEMIHCIA